MSLCLEIELARFSNSAQLYVVSVVKSFLNVLVRNIRDAEQYVPEFSFNIGYFRVELLDAVRELLHLLEETRYILSFFLEFRNFA